MCMGIYSHIIYYFLFYVYLLLLSGDVEFNPGPSHFGRNKCRILYSNIRGLHANLNELSFISKNYDIILCSETLVSDMRHVSEVLIPNFKKPNLLRRRAINRAQGLAVYVKQGHLAYLQPKFECGCHEACIIKICGKLANFYIFCLYRNPDLDDSIYDCLLVSMAAIQSCDKKASFIFVGDLNAHHVDWLNSVSPTNSHGQAAWDFASASGCTQLVSQPTHTSGNRLDLVLTDAPGVVDVSVFPPIGSSDHSAISISVCIEQPILDEQINRKVYLKNSVNWDDVNFRVLNIPWKVIFDCPSPVDALNTYLLNIINECVPSRILKFRLRDKPWFNDSCRRIYDVKQTAYRTWTRHRTHANWLDYTRLRAQAVNVYDAAKTEYNRHLQETLNNASQPHKWWSSLKSAVFGVDTSIPPLLNPDGSVTSSLNAKAELLSSVFDGKQSRQSIDLPPTCFPEPRLTSLAFRSKLVESLLLDLDSYGGVDPMGIFPLFLKKTAKILAPKVSVIFRILIKNGSFPLSWRVGHITPIPKGKSPTPIPLEYRPISITSILSKVFERLLASKLSKYAIGNNLIPQDQFAYQKGLGTPDALLCISHKLQSALDQGHEGRLVQIDFSAAFDRVNHKGLIYKLQLYGVGGSFLSILSEFLSNRTQRVALDGCLSNTVDVVSGVPQGSVLGPLLFIIYCRDMWEDLENNLISYADDATLLATIASPDDRVHIADSLNRDLHRIESWCAMWGMKLNPSKTQSMIISRSRTSDPPHPALSINNVVLANSSSLKILGVIFDSRLTFELHIRQMVSSASQKIGIIRKGFSLFHDNNINKVCFISFLLPILEYCAPVWSSAAQCHLKLIDKVLSRVRFLCNDANSVDLSHRRSVGALCLFYKIYMNPNHQLHSVLPESYVPARSTRYASAAHRHTLKSIRCRTGQFSRCFMPSTVELWNSLPDTVFEGGTLQSFKSSVNLLLNN